LDDIDERKKNHQECLLDLRRAYENETRQLAQLDYILSKQRRKVEEVTKSDRFGRADENEDDVTEAADIGKNKT
jgi:hypothetical protein